MEELEALKAELEELKKSNEVLLSDKKKILDEKKKLQAKTEGVDVEKYFSMSDELETLRAEHAKVTKLSKLEIEKLSKSLQDKDSAIQRHLIEDGLSTHLAKVGVRPEFIEASKALLRQKTSLKEENGAYQALLGDKPLTDGIAEWVSGEGKHFIQASGGSGGGASGSSGNGNDLRKYFDKTNPEFSLTKQAEVYQSNPQLFEQLKG